MKDQDKAKRREKKREEIKKYGIVSPLCPHLVFSHFVQLTGYHSNKMSGHGYWSSRKSSCTMKWHEWKANKFGFSSEGESDQLFLLALLLRFTPSTSWRRNRAAVKIKDFLLSSSSSSSSSAHYRGMDCVVNHMNVFTMVIQAWPLELGLVDGIMSNISEELRDSGLCFFPTTAASAADEDNGDEQADIYLVCCKYIYFSEKRRAFCPNKQRVHAGHKNHPTPHLVLVLSLLFAVAGQVNITMSFFSAWLYWWLCMYVLCIQLSGRSKKAIGWVHSRGKREQTGICISARIINNNIVNF